ncbi:MAG: TerC family protein, partial [Rhodospirillaceae bacterium]
MVIARLPAETQAKARVLGLAGALVFRVILLGSLVWLVGLTKPVLTLFEIAFSWRDFILIGGGLFLMYKGTWEIHATVEGEEDDGPGAGKTMAFGVAIVQIMVLDIIFSLDSVITAVGMTLDLPVMVTA